MWRVSSNRPPKSKSPRPSLSPRSTLTEVLRNNPYRRKDAASSNQSLNPPIEDPTAPLNKDLRILANFYPDVQIEVLRELLLRFDGDSRLQICIEQLYRYKSEWVKGRIQNPPRDLDEPLPKDLQFRTEEYTQASKRSLCREFSALNKSAVEGVLAEVNNSYTKARPILQEIAAKSWRTTFTNLFRRKKDVQETPFFIWEKGCVGQQIALTGSEELDLELHTIFIGSEPDLRKTLQEDSDLQLAITFNQQEAEDADALFECSICLNEVAFEGVATCSWDCHVTCLECVRRSAHEAIFGQSWTTSVNVELGTLKCLAPTEDVCPGLISSALFKRAISAEKAGAELLAKFEDRLNEYNLLKAQLPLIRCPFCSYAEADQEFNLRSARQIAWRFRKLRVEDAIFVIVFCEFLLPSLLLLSLLLTCIQPAFISTLFYTALNNITRSQQTTRFVCRNHSCGRASCTKCLKAWHDPHTCHEPLVISLRQSVEAARTAAVKRVCPRCGMSFVKSSGCNKLTCTCGYSMCYLCRKNIGKTGEGGEGYRHFCEHFRPVPGQRCTECDKCDLYKELDEDAMVRRAGEQAEYDWRVREGMVGVKGFEDAIDQVTLAKNEGVFKNFWRGRWTVQGVVDWAVNKMIIIEA